MRSLSEEEVSEIVRTLTLAIKLFDLGYEKHEWESNKTPNEYFDRLANEINERIIKIIRGLGH